MTKTFTFPNCLSTFYKELSVCYGHRTVESQRYSEITVAYPH